MTDDEANFEVAYANLMTYHGVEPALVDVAVTRARTRPRKDQDHLERVLEEMRNAALQDRAQRPR